MATYDPEDAVVDADGGCRIEFDATPNAAETVVPSGFNEWRGRFEARLSEPARDGRANAELVEVLETLLDADTQLVAGRTNSRKSLLVATDRTRALSVLEAQIDR